MQDSSSPSIRNIRAAESSGGVSKVLPMVLLVAVIALASVYLISQFGNQDSQTDNDPADNSDTNTETEVTPTVTVTSIATPTATVTPTSSETDVTVEVPANWKEIEIEGIGYKFYRPSTWFFRRNASTLGIAPEPIPTESETAGLVTITQRSGSLSSVVSSTKSSLDSATEESLDAGPNSWIIIEGSEDSVIFGTRKAKIGVIENSGKVYVLEYRTAPEAFNSNVNVFNTLLGIITFE